MKKYQVQLPTRLLTFLKENIELSTKNLRWSIEHGRCLVNGCVQRFGSTSLQKGDKIVVWPTKCPVFQREEERVLYDSADFLVYNKPPYIASSALANILKLHLVHRLDRDTTGVIVFARNNPNRLEKLFKERKVKKTYHALVEGVPRKKGVFCARMRKIKKREGAVVWGISRKGLWSKTEWKIEKVGKNSARIRCHPLTGRTHQIRVHLKEMGYPILGDREYGSRKTRPGIFHILLHASEIYFDSLRISAPFPPDFVAWENKLLQKNLPN